MARPIQTHCKRGHEYNERDTYFKANGRVHSCRVCNITRNRLRYRHDDVYRQHKLQAGRDYRAKLKASVWMVAAGFLGLIAALLVIQAIVFAIASFGLALHWACLLVAAVLAAGAAAAFYHGRSLAEEPLLPERSIQQITRDIKTAREQLT